MCLDWGQEEKGTTEDEMAGWHYGLDGQESEWTPGVGDGQGGLACCDSGGRKESDMTERLNWTELNWDTWTYQVALVVKNPPANAGDKRDAGSIPGWESPLEEGMGTHSSILAWRIPWTEEPGGLWSIESQRIRHDWSDLACVHENIHRKQKQTNTFTEKSLK